MSTRKLIIICTAVLLAFVAALYAILSMYAAKSAQQINYTIPSNNIDASDLLKPSKEDIIYGKMDAKTTLVIYDSYSCHHCADFYKNTFPELEKSYISKGLVRYIHRELPLDKPAFVATQLMKCFVKRHQEKYFNVIKAVYLSQEAWFMATDIKSAISPVFVAAGMTKKEIESCLLDKNLEERILSDRLQASNVLSINSTPTIFINGSRIKPGENNISGLAKALDEIVA